MNIAATQIDAVGDTKITPADVLGCLNEVEAKNAPSVLHLRGDASLLEHGLRVSVVGSRKASAERIAARCGLGRGARPSRNHGGERPG